MARYDTQFPFRFPDDTMHAAVTVAIGEFGLKVISCANVKSGGWVVNAKQPKSSTLDRDQPAVRLSWFHPREDPAMFWLCIHVEAMGVKREMVQSITRLGDEMMARIQDYCNRAK